MTRDSTIPDLVIKIGHKNKRPHEQNYYRKFRGFFASSPLRYKKYAPPLCQRAPSSPERKLPELSGTGTIHALLIPEAEGFRPNDTEKAMENTIYIGLSRAQTLQTAMDLTSNNVANMDTPGYRGQNPLFIEYISDPKGKTETNDPISMVYDYGQYQVTKPGPIQRTENPTDVALSGPGFFGVQTKDGVQYTRAGNFSLNASGQLVTPSGLLVAGQGGGPITIPRDAKEIKISEDGTISTDQGQVGQIGVTEFDNVQDLEPTGDNLYKATKAGKPSTGTKVMQGMIEGSNVQPVLEMTRMVNILREYQSVQRLIQGEHERIRSAIQRLSKTS